MEFKHGVTLHKDETYALSVSLDLGYMTPDDLITLANLAKKYQVNTMSATTAKKISFMDVREADVNALWADLEQAFGDRLGFPKGKIIVCPGSHFCKFAAAGMDNHALGRKIEAISQKHDAGKLKVGISCCPLGCSMPRIRDIGVIAAPKGWQLYAGGNGGAKPAINEPIAKDLTEEELLRLIDRTYQYFTAHKTGKERGARVIERLGLEHFKAFVLEGK